MDNGQWTIKKGKPLMSHRSTAYPCFLPDLGEFSRSWSHETYPAAKVQQIVQSSKIKLQSWSFR